ncbi:hypothetical protein RRG08_006457, partial [Elysia crispata]
AIPDTWVSTSLLTIPSTKSVQNMCWCTNFFSFLRDLNPKKDVSKVVNQDSMALCSRLRDSKEHVGKLLAATRTARIVSTKANYNSWVLIFNFFWGGHTRYLGFYQPLWKTFQKSVLTNMGFYCQKIVLVYKIVFFVSKVCVFWDGHTRYLGFYQPLCKPSNKSVFTNMGFHCTKFVLGYKFISLLRDLNPKKDVSKVVNQDSMALCSRLRDSKKRVGKLLAATRTAHIVSTKANYNSLIPPILAANVIGILSVAETAVHDISMSASNFARA